MANLVPFGSDGGGLYLEAKYEQFVNRYAYDVNDRIEYRGTALPNTPTDGVGWQIVKYAYDAGGLILSSMGPREPVDDGGAESLAAVFVWDDYAGYDYGPA